MAEHSDDDKTRSLPDDGDADGAKLTKRPFSTPPEGHIFGLDGVFVSHWMSADTLEWHFKHEDHGSYLEIKERAIGTPVYRKAPPRLKLGKTAIHNRYFGSFGESPWFDTGWFWVAFPPRTSYLYAPVFDTPRPTLTGIAEPRSRCALYTGDKRTLLSDVLPADSSGNWSIPILASLTPGRHTLLLRMTVDGWLGEIWSALIDIVVLFSPTITRPDPRVEQPSTGIIFSGECTPGCTMTVVSANNPGVTFSDAKKFDDAAWELRSRPGLKLDEGPWSIRVKYEYLDLPPRYSAVHSFTVKDAPVEPKPPRVPDINFPDILSIQNQKFSAWGFGGVAGAKVKCFLDGENIPRGQTTAIDNYWRADIELPPGTRSLVVEQTLNGMASGRSIPRAFRIRPPKVETATFDTPTDNKVVSFSGSGYTGASVEIRITSGPAGASPPRIVDVVGGEWKTTAPNWPYGTYKLEVIQKVPDNASGWIESEAFPLTVDHVLPDVSAVEVIADYQPIFSGEGYTGATVKLFNADGVTPIAPEVKVYEGKWKTTATDVWGPTLNRKVYIKQYLNGQSSAKWIDVPVTIAPRAPEVTEVLEDELSPKIIGTGWPGAILTLVYNVDGIFHKPPNKNGRWEFKRTLPFEPGLTHRFTVIQHYAGQTSSPASGTFVVYRPMVQPRITYPGPNAKVGRDVTVSGDGGMKGATMQLRNVRSERDLGPPIVLNADGAWSIDVVGLVFDLHTIDAQQTLDGRLSVRSQPVAFDVVLLPPEITVPEPNDTRERTSLVRGTGIPFGKVELWLAGMTSPWQTNIDVRANGDWEMYVSLPVGNKTLWARQAFVLDGKTYESQNTEPVTYGVVPAAPFIESPAADEHVGRRMVVSGFGVVGDTVMATLGAAMGRDEVKQDRTWSITLDADQIGGVRDLVVVSTCSDFESAPAKQTVVQGTYLPTLSRPEAGRRVANPVQFAGQGRAGIGEVRSWYDPDLKWVPQVIVTDGAWHATATQSLPGNGCWCWFKQTLTDDANGETVSDWVLSNRFEVDLTGEKKT